MKRVQEIVAKYKVKLLNEHELDVDVRNIMKCNEKENAFQDLYKKGLFFGSLDPGTRIRENRQKVLEDTV